MSRFMEGAKLQREHVDRFFFMTEFDAILFVSIELKN